MVSELANYPRREVGQDFSSTCIWSLLLESSGGAAGAAAAALGEGRGLVVAALVASRRAIVGATHARGKQDARLSARPHSNVAARMRVDIGRVWRALLGRQARKVRCATHSV